MKKSKTQKKPVLHYLSVVLKTMVLIIALFFMCKIIKADYDIFISTIDNGIRHWTIHPEDLL